MAGLFGGVLVVNSANVTYRILLPRGCADQTNGAVGRRAIIWGHGHGGDSTAIAPGNIAGDHPRVWADAGYVVACIDNATEFFDNDAIDRQNALRTRLTTVLGCKSRVGFSGMSMGGGTALAYLLLNPTLVSCVWAFAPASDLRWIGSAAGYTPAYSTDSLTADPAWSTELATDYPSGYTSHDPMQNIAAYRGTVPVKIAHATDDNFLPYDGSRYFVNQVADSKVTFRLPDVTGGHTVTFVRNIPTKETTDFFNGQWVD